MATLQHMPRARLIAVLTAVLILAALLASAAPHRQLYDDLNVEVGASKETIKQAFRRLTRMHHPDTKDTAEEKEVAKVTMAKILRAYEVLADDGKRQDYDAAGVIPGEAPDPRGFTANELFEYFHQRTPIFSKAVTIDDMQTLQRIKAYRGPRVFLVQAYDDACAKCRVFSTAWETLLHSSLVEAGVLEMYRIEGRSGAEGDALLKALGIRYKGATPEVVAVIDGETWKLHDLSEVLPSRNERRIFQTLLDFVMLFFYEVYSTETSLKVAAVDDIMQYLSAPRAAATAAQILFPSISAESVPVALQLRYPRVEVRSVAREELLPFVEDYCDLRVDVKDRFGDVVPVPEFVVVSSAPLKRETDEEGVNLCANIDIGAAASLTYSRASQFIESLLPPHHAGMEGIAFVNAITHWDLCRKNCLLWVRPDCTDTPDADVAQVAKLMKQSFFSFKPGYLCMNENPKVAQMVARTGRAASAGPILLAFVNSDDSTAYRLTEVESKSVGDITTSDVDGILADIVEGVRKDGRTTLTQPFPMLLAAMAFPMSRKHRLYLLGITVFKYCRPFISNTMPILIMYLIHTKVLNRRNDAAESAGQGSANASASTATTTSAATAASPAPPHKPIPALTPKDLTDAKEGKGFLILLLDERPFPRGVPSLSSVALDQRFTIRELGASDTAWKNWIMANKPDGDAGDAVPSAERGVAVVAVRMNRMTAAVKSDATPMDTFFQDLLDGTTPAKLELPTLADS